MGDPHPAKPMVLREDEAAYEVLEAAPALELGRVLTTAGTTALGGGFARFRTEGELAGWTLEYDEVFFVLSGELTLRREDETLRAGPGEILLIPKGATVTYRGAAGTKAFFVLHPRNWAARDAGAPEAGGG
jgi:ethanolamine utilization protein EutQ (cupin superfamily)